MNKLLSDLGVVALNVARLSESFVQLKNDSASRATFESVSLPQRN